MKKIKLLIVLLFVQLLALASETEGAMVQTVHSGPSLGLSQSELLIVISLLFALVLVFVSLTLLRAFKVMYQEQMKPTPYVAPVKTAPLKYEDWLRHKKTGKSLWAKLLGLKPISEEKDLEIDHAYDGIKELNNPVPAWFNFLFFGTMIFAASYLIYYHIGGYGDLQDKEYQNELAKAQMEKAAYLEKSANTIDENNVKVDRTPPTLQEGNSIFEGNCKVCHGDKGQGIIGPNLTDEFWLHGGGIHNVFKTIKYGVPAKGMISWEKNLTPKQIAAVANYIISLSGTHPAGAKAPQGEKYEEKIPEDQSMKPVEQATIANK
ncbi:cbb3-type cytochrome c oxidase N-terminal domain-containing protein [Pedobacter sandarakinus]|uniref:cbb3-type cytochrome c oxidase N-terminal domain-containing protein n=1 Tax=Pedobacter sandarakinus TaxID=353156 RepID=UPI0022461CEA|nr:cbb3-type cytochrome c oxidase N-terminal domain-containing protein [Pedobacter sandarakinus]MCX2574927.1 c-type cytochrome [Pedobacter sandarakinus]